MHHDKKVGLGLGILLVGIIGAFFFREEPRVRDPLPELQSAESLDREITESLVDTAKPFSPLEQYERQYRPAIDIQGIEIAEPEPKPAEPEKIDSEIASTAKKVFDEEFDFLNDPTEPTPVQPEVAIRSDAEEPTQQPEMKTPVKPQDVAVSRTTPDQDLTSGTGMFPSDSTSETAKPREPFVEDLPVVTLEIPDNSSKPAKPETPRASPEHSLYTVRQGDTLSGISLQLFGRQADYRTIFEMNRDQLASPDDLRPGMKLKIPVTKGLNRSTEISLAEPKDPPQAHFTESNAEGKQPQEQPPKRDRRVIVPRRVRLNEPIADNPNKHLGSAPRALFTLTPDESETDDSLLPTLEGLEPLELPR